MNMITIPKEITKQGDLVIVPRKKYEQLLKWETELKDALGKIERGRKEYKTGKTRTASSPRSLRR